GLVVGVIGLVLTVLAYLDIFVTPTPSALQRYDGLVHRSEGNYNTLLSIVGPIMLIIGGFYFGEQLVLRRRFEKLLDTPKRSEFSSRRKDLEDLAKRLPDKFGDRISAKESE